MRNLGFAIRRAVDEIGRRDRLLAATGWLNLALFVVMLAVALFDTRTVMGVNPWIKPMKFALSIAIFVWTIAWFRPYLGGGAKAGRAVSLAIAVSLAGEIACITVQAARGTTSHYNTTTPFNAAVFAVMAALIFVNTTAIATVLALMTRPARPLPPAYAWGVRLGLAAIFLGSLEGAVMIFHNAHTVGLPDGGSGLFFLNWSTRAGDLRIAHFLGMHALQILPLVGYATGRWAPAVPERQQIGVVVAFGITYAMAVAWTFSRARAGMPLWRI